MNTLHTGVFYVPSQSGFGLMLHVNGDRVGGGFYAHREDGTQLYMIFAGTNAPYDSAMPLHVPQSYEFPASPVVVNHPAGEITLTPFPGRYDKLIAKVRLASKFINRQASPPAPEYIEHRFEMLRLL